MMGRFANILIIILEILGLRVSIGDRKWRIFAYYTQISNLITIVSFTLFILVPFGGGFRRLMLSGNGLYHHTLCPVLSVISYILWEGHSSAWMIPVAITFVYGIVMMYMNYREWFDGPYPFFRVNHQSRLATIFWMAALTGMITVISLLIRWIA